MNLPTYPSAQQAYLQSLELLGQHGRWVDAVNDPTSVGSRFGQASRKTLELLGAGFVLTNPRNRLVQNTVRRVDPVFAIANTLWHFSGSNLLDPIEFYNPRGRSFSSDGETLVGAVGHRIFSHVWSSQFANVIRILRDDAPSRRAAVQVFSPTDTVAPPLDTPCTLSLQYFIRDRKLCAITNMRSQAAVTLLPYDIFVFTMIQEALSVELGTELGPYYHFCNSLHYYDDEAETATRIVDSGDDRSICMPTMTCSPTAKSQLFDVAESKVRAKIKTKSSTLLSTDETGLDIYWTDIMNVMILGRVEVQHNPDSSYRLDIPASYSWWLSQ